MSKKGKEFDIKFDSAEIENPYFDSRNDWNVLYDKERLNAQRWRAFGIGSLALSALAVAGMIYAAQLPDVIPYLFKEDGSGGITALGVPNQVMKVDDRVIANQMAGFIIALRQVPIETELRSDYVRTVKMMSTAPLFLNQLAPMLRDEYQNAGTGTIKVEVTSVLRVDKNTWEIAWKESINGKPMGKYKGMISYQRDTTLKDPSLLLFNPLGIIIKDININKEIGS